MGPEYSPPAAEPPESFILDVENAAAGERGRVVTPEQLQQLLVTTKITLVADFLARGRTVDDYQGAIAMYMKEFAKAGDLEALAKAILKTVALRDHLAERR